jgi:DNA (cytosine-5)-methyltransferase 1
MELTHVSLFSGIGGLDLAAEWAGFKTVLFCEKDKFCQKVLKKHWPEVPVVEDIHELKRENVPQPVTVISGGFPCQPFSVAGKRRGEDDDRFLWPETIRCVSQIRPAWFIGENVAGIVSMALDDVLSDLEDAGYEVQPFLIPACGVGALHRRNRVFIVAHDDSIGLPRPLLPISARGQNEEKINFGRHCFPSNADNSGQQERRRRKRVQEEYYPTEYTGQITADTDWRRCQQRKEGFGRIPEFDPDCWETEPAVGRVADGVPHRVDRLRALGNAVVPQQAYPIFKAIADIEKNTGI